LNNNNFKSLEELIDNIARGGEVEFEYNREQYSITHSPKGIHIMQFYKYETESIFKTPNEIAGYQLGDELLGDVIERLNVVFRCFH
jgi:hypothetical protein